MHHAVQTKKDPVYMWKALRLATRESLTGVAQALEPLAKTKKRKAIDLEDIVHRLLPVRCCLLKPLGHCLQPFSCPYAGRD